MSDGSPLFRWSPPHRITHAELVCELGERFTLRGRRVVLDVNQRAVLEDVFAEESAGVPTCFSVAMVGPRQTIGKTTTLGLAAIADLVLFDADLHLWTAHRSFAATAAFRLMRAMIKSDPDTKALFKWPPVAGKGQEVLETLDGRRIPFLSRQNASGRSETASKITVDEALFAGEDDIGAILPTLVTVPDAQVRYASSGGMGSSEFLRGLRDAGRAGGDPRRAWHEFGATPRDCERMACDHLDLNDRGCALNDRGLWMQASPTDRASERDIADQRKEMSPREFAREFLTWWDEPDEHVHVIDLVKWAAREIRRDSPDARHEMPSVALAVETSRDHSLTSVGVAGRRPDGRAQIEVVERRPGTAWLPAWVAERVRMHRPCAVVVDPGGPAGFLIAKLTELGVDVVETTARELGQACGDFETAVNEDGLVHLGDPVLTTALRVVQKRKIGEAWGFERENPKADIAPLMAVTLALHGLTARGDRPSGYESRGFTVL